MNSPIEEAASLLSECRRVVVFSGAGVSAESGIPTFRDDDGFWREFPPEHYANWRGLVATAVGRPRKFARFVDAVIGPVADARPNAAHRAIAEAEQSVALEVVTQNIDGLHQSAGSRAVHEVHGSFFETVSQSGEPLWRNTRGQLRKSARAVRNARGGLFPLARTLLAMRRFVGVGVSGVWRPNLVLFGDALAEPAWSDALEATRRCDCLLQVGCSGAVMPAAMLPQIAQAEGAAVIAVDPNPTPADYWLEGLASEVVPELFDLAFGSGGVAVV